MLWLKLWPYALGAILFGALGAFTAHTLDGKRYDALALDFAQYRIASSEAAIKAQEAARAELEAQIEQTHKVILNNQTVLANVQNTTAAVMADRDHLRGLLAGATRALASRDLLPEAGDRSATAPAGAPSGDGRVDQLVGRAERAITECKLNASQLDGLSAQMQPQL
jgi:hypothetical protein